MDIRLGQIQPRRSRTKRRQFSVRASTPPGSHEKRPRLRCSCSVASAAIRLKPTRPSVTAASSSANAVPRGATRDVRFGPEVDISGGPISGSVLGAESGLSHRTFNHVVTACEEHRCTRAVTALKMISILIWSGEQLLHRIHRRVNCIQP